MPVFAGTPVDNAPPSPAAAPPPRMVFKGTPVSPAAPAAPANDTAPANDAGGPKMVFAGTPVDDAPSPTTLPGRAASYVAGEVGSAVKGSWEQLKTDFLNSLPDPSKAPPENFWDEQKAHFDRLMSTGKSAVDAFNLVTSPLSGLFTALVAKPFGQAVEKGTGLLPKGFQIPAAEGEKAIGQATMALGPKGGLGAARTGAEAAAAARAAEAPKPVTEAPKPTAVAAPAPEGEAAATGPAPPAAAPPEVPPAAPASPPPGPAPAAPPAAASAMPSEGALAHPPVLTKPRSFEDQLFQLEGNKVADRIDTLKALKEVPEGVASDTWEKLYHFEEDPKGVTLTPEERDLYDKHVAPLKAEADNLASKLETFGYPVEEREHLTAQPDSEGYTPRYVAGRTRSFGEVLDQWKQGVEAKFGGAAGRSMRKTVDAQKSRRFWNAVNPSTGERTVVHVGTDGTVLGFDGTTEPREVGTFGKGQKIEAGSKVRVGGETWKLEPATTKEIEAVAQTRYQKNVLANRLDNVAKLRSAVRNAQFIEDMKASPDWEKVAVKVSDHASAPVTNGREWRIPKMPQFRQYYMEAPLADALDDALGRQREIEGLESALDKAGSFIKGSIFWNPIPHMRNVANHYFVEKGLVGTATSIPSTFKSLLNAARSVATQDADYMRILRSGASLPYARNITRDVHNTLISKLGEDVAANPGAWKHIATLAGKANPVELIRSLYSVSNTALWSFGDALSVARIKELEGKGMSLEKAIRETEAHMPNYRVPGQVLGQRMLSEILTHPLATMFGRYQYNRLASYMTMARDLVARDVPLKQRAETLDKLAMLGVLLTVYYPMLDKAWQAITSNPNAKVSRPGAMSVPQAAIDVATGEKGPAQGAQSVFSIGTIEAPIELIRGKYSWSGLPIAYPENLTDGHPGQFIRDLLAWVGSKLQPIGQAQRIIGGTTTPSQFLLQQIGVSSPTEQQAAAKEHFKAKDAQDAARRAGRLELQRSAQ